MRHKGAPFEQKLDRKTDLRSYFKSLVNGSLLLITKVCVLEVYTLQMGCDKAWQQPCYQLHSLRTSARPHWHLH